MARTKPQRASSETKKLSFYEQLFIKRFNISMDLSEAQRRFVNRIGNLVFDDFFENDVKENILRGEVLWQVANDLGEQYEWEAEFDDYVENDFAKCLQALESAYRALDSQNLKRDLNELIREAVKSSEIDLGIEWTHGVFIPKGAALLDRALINENITWLSEPKYSNVYAPFEKGLAHYYRVQKEPKFGYDVITDMYEALESMAKIVTSRPGHDLSGNAELFINKVKASDGYKSILKSYIQYANDFRHGLDSKVKRAQLGAAEVESFIYLTGLFIRLAKPSEK